MSITDELREFYQRADGYELWCPRHRRELAEIADRIDAELAERYMPLPVDANGVPIKVGDVLDPPRDCKDYVPLMVTRLTYDSYENEWFFDGEAGGFTGLLGEHMDVAGWTHHHEPTVEDVLREMLQRSEDMRHGPKAFDPFELIDEYAAKLRLAGEDE